MPCKGTLNFGNPLGCVFLLVLDYMTPTSLLKKPHNSNLYNLLYNPL